MPGISITDKLGLAVAGVKVDFTQPSSLAEYAQSQILHLLVAPDFVARKDQPLTLAAAEPVRFQSRLGNDALLRAVTTAGADLFENDAFHVRAEIAAGGGYAALAFTGALDAGGSMAIEFLKAFPTGADEPTLGNAVEQMLSGYVVPAGLADLKRLQEGDICTVTRQGSLMVSGGFPVVATVNPLASVNLPLNAGTPDVSTLDVKTGLMAGVAADFTLSGSFQIRARRASGRIELSFLRDRGSRLRADFHAAAFNGADLFSALLGAISTNTSPRKLVHGLTPDEIQAFQAAVQEGVAHSIQASLDVVLAADGEAAFRYELDLNALDEDSTAALDRALRGDLTGLTALEGPAGAGGTLAPGVRLIESMLVRAREAGVTLKVNLLGILNLLSLSKLMSKCEILTEPASGDLTIKETAQSERIGAINDPLHRQEALRKALFESVLVTTTYRAAGAVAPGLDCECLHFVVNRGTAPAGVREYLNWFAALGLTPQAEAHVLLGRYGGAKTSACVLRAAFNDAACGCLFFENGKLLPEDYYLECGREALRAMLAPTTEGVDHARYRVLDEMTRWAGALHDGPSPELRHVIPLDEQDPHFEIALARVISDVYDIVWWARSMRDAGAALVAARESRAGRDALQKTILKGDRREPSALRPALVDSG